MGNAFTALPIWYFKRNRSTCASCAEAARFHSCAAFLRKHFFWGFCKQRHRIGSANPLNGNTAGRCFCGVKMVPFPQIGAVVAVGDVDKTRLDFAGDEDKELRGSVPARVLEGELPNVAGYPFRQHGAQSRRGIVDSFDHGIHFLSGCFLWFRIERGG